jgi:hypothetical protein
LTVLALTAPLAAAEPAPPGIRVYESDPQVTEGETLVNGDADVLFAEVLDYAKWPQIFPDVARVEVTKRFGDEALVTLIAPTGHRDNLHFKNQPQVGMIFFEDTGSRHSDVWAEIMFIPGTQPGTTRVHARLFAKVHGIATLVVGEDEVRQQREQKIERDLVHIREYVARRRVAAP